MFHSPYKQEGVSVSPAFPSTDGEITVTYQGLLPKSGAREVYARFCFNEDWNNMNETKMTRCLSGFRTCLLPPPDAISLSLCFRDPADNWDNNSGMNYSFTIHNSTLETLQHLHSALETIRGQARDDKGKELVDSLIADIGWIADAFGSSAPTEVI